MSKMQIHALALSVPLMLFTMDYSIRACDSSASTNHSWIKCQLNRFIVTHFNLKGIPKLTIERVFGHPDGRNVDASGSVTAILENWRKGPFM